MFLSETKKTPALDIRPKHLLSYLAGTVCFEAFKSTFSEGAHASGGALKWSLSSS